MSKTINWGIIGCGNVTEKKSGPAFNKVKNAKLNAVMRRDTSKAKDYAQRHGVPHFFSDASDLIHSPYVDAVYVATPPSSHAEYAIMAMKAGKPVYVEKPMAASYADCLKMLKVSEETGSPIFVAYYRRTLPGFLKAKELIDEGTIGQVLAVNIRLSRPMNQDEQEQTWRVDKDIAGGGIFFDLASHQLDYLDFLFGPIVKANGAATNNNSYYDVEDTVVASFQFENGVIGSGLWSFNTHEDAARDTLEIIGDKGSILCGSFSHEPIKLITDQGVIEFPYLNPENIQYNLIKQVNEAILNKNDCVSTGISAARTNKVLEEIVYREQLSVIS
ncbi:Gfo/Idh/MocA family oxidoreductase [Labilibacter sediminis]|nr:Gfo/Idh/MocA family oxidoreductase [Labilibacter sediminis]